MKVNVQKIEVPPELQDRVKALIEAQMAEDGLTSGVLKMPADLAKALGLPVDGEGCGDCPGCDEELNAEYEAKVPEFVRTMIEAMVKAKGYPPEKHKASMKEAMHMAIAKAAEINSPGDLEVPDELKEAIESLRDLLVQSIQPEKEKYKPKYEMICEQVILAKDRDGTMSRIFQQFVSTKGDKAYDKRVFKELKEQMKLIAPYDDWDPVETDDDNVAVVTVKVGGVKYQAKQIGHKLRVG